MVECGAGLYSRHLGVGCAPVSFESGLLANVAVGSSDRAANMKPGETVEIAIWSDGTDTPEQLARWKADVLKDMLEAARADNVALTPLRWIEKSPGDDRVPEVPDHIQGPSVKLLVAEADVQVMFAGPNFLAELEPYDLARIRRITREAYQRWWNTKFKHRSVPLTNPQCDTLINDLGPEAAEASLRSGKMLIQ